MRAWNWDENSAKLPSNAERPRLRGRMSFRHVRLRPAVPVAGAMVALREDSPAP
jgi:hypothetical protein